MSRATYYAVIPATVRYADITPSAKLLYGELTALTEQEGFCWASNAYFANLYKAGQRSVSRWLAELEEGGFIRIEPAANQHGQRKIFIADALPKMASQKWQAKNGDHNNTRRITLQEEHRCARFDEFWEEYPNKVGKKVCLSKWKANKLDDCFDAIMEGLRRWKSSDRWARGYIADPLTFLNQERWKDTPPAEVKPLQKGEIRVRETTPQEAEETKQREEFLRLSRLHPAKSDDELWGMVEQNRRAM